MKYLFDEYGTREFLKPGQVIVASEPVVVSTILGSCVAVTMHFPDGKTGAICHAALPNNPGMRENLLYVDSAVHHLYRQMSRYGGRKTPIVKLFGGAQLLPPERYAEGRHTVGDQNILQAERTLEELGLRISNADTGGTMGRQLFFFMETGDVYLRRVKVQDLAAGQEVCI